MAQMGKNIYNTVIIEYYGFILKRVYYFVLDFCDWVKKGRVISEAVGHLVVISAVMACRLE